MDWFYCLGQCVKMVCSSWDRESKWTDKLRQVAFTCTHGNRVYSWCLSLQVSHPVWFTRNPMFSLKLFPFFSYLTVRINTALAAPVCCQTAHAVLLLLPLVCSVQCLVLSVQVLNPQERRLKWNVSLYHRVGESCKHWGNSILTSIFQNGPEAEVNCGYQENIEGHDPQIYQQLRLSAHLGG